MLVIFKEIIYKSKNKFTHPKWYQHYILVVKYNPLDYSFLVRVERYIWYDINQKLKLRKTISFKDIHYKYKDISSDLIKPLLDKYGYRIKNFRLFNDMILAINNNYDKVKKQIAELLFFFPESLVYNHIIPYLI